MMFINQLAFTVDWATYFAETYTSCHRSFFAVLIWAFYPRENDLNRPDPEFLATDAYFRLGDFVISVPVVSVQRLTEPPNNTDPLPKFRNSGPFGESRWFATQNYKTAMREFAAEPTQPAEVSNIRLNFGVYGTYGEYGISQEICPKLSSEWSRKACNNQLRMELKNLPADLYLSTELGLKVFEHHHFAGLPNAEVAALIDEMYPIQNKANVACADGQNKCYAAILIADGIYAVWSFICTNAHEAVCENKLIAEGAEVLKFVATKLRAG